MGGFFIAENLANLSEGDTIALSRTEGKHASASRRIRIGEEIGLTNMFGYTAKARVIRASMERSDSINVRVEKIAIHEKNPVTVSLVQALCKRANTEQALRSAVELGVDRIIPWNSERSFRSSSRRWSSLTREAAKQSCRAWFPVVEPDISSVHLSDSLHCEKGQWGTLGCSPNIAPNGAVKTPSNISRNKSTHNSVRIVLDPNAEIKLSSLKDVFVDTKSVLLFIGPEGGITPEEIDAISGITCSLGNEILKSSTATTAALSLLNVFLGRW